MKQKFNLGDEVEVKFTGQISRIEINNGEISYKVDSLNEPMATYLRERDITLKEA